jgi:arylsulfatase A
MQKTLLSLLGLLFLMVELQAKSHPNVVILLADDLGYQDVGCYGGPVKTPAIDQLAKEGTRFTDFYSGCAVCSPSRATLLTGRHHIRTGVYSWISDETQNSHLLLRERTLAEILKDQGYSTAHIGKWHLGLPTPNRAKPTPSHHGFDYWFTTWNNASPSHKNPDNFIRNGKDVGLMEGYSCQLVADEAIEWLDEHRHPKAPFFLNIWFHEPHAPIAAPDEIVKTYGELKSRPAIYSGTIDNTDRAIKRIVEKLIMMGVRENTIIIYASDNGSYMDDRTGHLKGKKGVNWDGGIRVPGIFSWPGVIQENVSLSEPAGLVDVLPTLCELLGFEAPQDRVIDGSSIASLLKGEAKDFSRHQPLFWHLQKSRPIVAMRDGNYSLVAAPDYEISKSNMFQEVWIPKIKQGGYKDYQLFDLLKDPGQSINLAPQNPELVKKLKEKLLKINASIMSEAMDWHLQ